jgi:hypothetical protein
MSFKTVKLALVTALAAGMLTACTPPMPPEVQAALAEASYTCVDGNGTASIPSVMDDATPILTDSLLGNCPGMTLEPVVGAADLAIFEGATPAECKAFNTVPYALDAGVISVTLESASGVILTPKTVQGIFDGTITNWEDPAITADNEDTELSVGPIQVFAPTDTLALKAFSDWFNHLTGKPFKAPLLKPQAGLTMDDLGELPEGSIALIPFSVFNAYSVEAYTVPLAASIVADKVNTLGVVADAGGVGSAGTQFKISKSDLGIDVAIDYSAKPIAPLGSDIAPDPYGATYPVKLGLCGQDTKLTRALARYLLRQDSQGALTTYVPLPDNIRAESLVVVSKGLPTPTDLPTK